MTENANSGEFRNAGASDREGMPARAESAWIDSRELFAGREEIVIRHGDQIYRLKITRYGRLILNK
jgi:hemin uptake protein HemP